MGTWNIDVKSIDFLINSFELLVGIPPFYDKNQNLMFSLIKESEVRFPKVIKISEEAKDFISKVTITSKITFSVSLRIQI